MTAVISRRAVAVGPAAVVHPAWSRPSPTVLAQPALIFPPIPPPVACWRCSPRTCLLGAVSWSSARALAWERPGSRRGCCPGPDDCGAGPGHRAARPAGQLAWLVELRHGDALDVLREGGTFDLIFADAPGGKHEGIELTIAALNPRGLLIVDDMTPVPQWPAELHAGQAEVRRALFASPLLTSVELACGSGVILCARRA